MPALGDAKVKRGRFDISSWRNHVDAIADVPNSGVALAKPCKPATRPAGTLAATRALLRPKVTNTCPRINPGDRLP
jgi:hypothetical protein